MQTRHLRAQRQSPIHLGLVFLGLLLGWPGLVRAQGSGAWTSIDVGDVGAPGSSSESGGVVTLNGSGLDIGGTLDEFHWRHLTWTGDGLFVVRVTGVSSVDNWAKIGVMVRADSGAGAPQVFAGVNPAQLAARVVRAAAGGDSTLRIGGDLFRAMRMWLKLIRDGNEFMVFYSSEGITWRPIDVPVSVPMPATALAGLAITSKADGRIATGTIDRVQFGPIVPERLVAIGRSPTRVELRWQDHALRETGFEVERSTDNVAFTRIAPAAANPSTDGSFTRFFDESASPVTNYWYRVRSIGPAGASGYSNAAPVITPPVPPPGWTGQDIGDTTAGGSVTESGGTFRVTGSGAGVGAINTLLYVSSNRGTQIYSVTGGEDQIYLAARPASGEGEIVARIDPIGGPAGAQAGILVRGGTAVNAPQTFLFVKPDGSAAVRVRRNFPNGFGGVDHSTAETAVPTEGTGPLWGKLVRTSGGVMAYASRDGANWTEVHWIRPAYGTDLLIGLGVASGENGTVATGTFDSVSIGPVTTSITPPAPADLVVTRFGVDDAALQWTDRTRASQRIAGEHAATLQKLFGGGPRVLEPIALAYQRRHLGRLPADKIERMQEILDRAGEEAATAEVARLLTPEERER